MSITLSTPTVDLAFPIGTKDTQWTFTITGTNPDNTPYNNTIDADTSSIPAPGDFQVGAVLTLVVTKNGVSSLPSDPFTVPAQTVMLTVPDASQKAVFTVA